MQQLVLKPCNPTSSSNSDQTLPFLASWRLSPPEPIMSYHASCTNRPHKATLFPNNNIRTLPRLILHPFGSTGLNNIQFQSSPGSVENSGCEIKLDYTSYLDTHIGAVGLVAGTMFRITEHAHLSISPLLSLSDPFRAKCNNFFYMAFDGDGCYQNGLSQLSATHKSASSPKHPNQPIQSYLRGK